MKLSKIFRKIYDATSDSRSSFGKVGKYAYPFNSQYLLRDAWRKYVKPRLVGQSNSAASLGYGSVYGPTGSIVGRI